MIDTLLLGRSVYGVVRNGAIQIGESQYGKDEGQTI